LSITNSLNQIGICISDITLDREAATRLVFVNNFISAVYGLKGRKVMPRILKKPKKINI